MYELPPIPSAGREVMWNVSAPANAVALYTLLAISLGIGVSGILRRAEIWGDGRPAPNHLKNALKRLFDLGFDGILQHQTHRERTPAIFHSLIYIGFLTLLFTTTMVFIDHDLGIKIYRGAFYLILTVLSDIFGLGLLLGVLLAAHRRHVRQPGFLHSRPADAFMLLSLAALVVQGFILEGLRIHVTGDIWAQFSPVGSAFAKFFWQLSSTSAKNLHWFVWWVHTINVFAIIAIAPYTKFFHILSSSANLFFRHGRGPLGQLEPIGDLEKILESEEEVTFGLGTIEDYSWKKRLDLDACTSCGRCQNVCPAYLAGKPLSPKWMILDTRNHLLGLQATSKIASKSLLPKPLVALDQTLLEKFLLGPSGVIKNKDKNGYSANGAYRGENIAVQSSSRLLGGSVDDRIAEDVMDPNVFWSCTTCMACVEVCPVGINHVDHIVGNRRNMVLMHGEIPSEAQATLKALETRGNPFGAPEDRFNWAAGLDVPVLQPGDEVEVLYWVGCVSAYDKRKQQIARSVVTLLNEAKISYGVLGNAESCSGDPARRLGEENLFQTLAKQNIEVLKGVRFNTLVANCPHCFNTIKNEYPEFGSLSLNGDEPEIIHHSALLRRLQKEKKIRLKDNNKDEEYTFHDPCYLGRYNDEYDAPRDALVQIGNLKLTEMERSREKGMCCGAGGGHFWMDLKQGERVNVLRTDQAAATGATRIATACPFCLQMMEDGVKLTEREATLTVKDIAEVLVEHLDLRR